MQIRANFAAELLVISCKLGVESEERKSPLIMNAHIGGTEIAHKFARRPSLAVDFR
jgi:hypothetical protein